MRTESVSELEKRALVLAPVGRGQAVAPTLLHEAGITAELCPDMGALVRELGRGAAAAVLGEEVTAGDLAALETWIAGQPPWSDLPIILLTRRGRGERVSAAARATRMLGNVTFLERPFHATTMLSVVRTAVRARMRQYAARERIAEHGRIAAELAVHRSRLQEMVAERTRALEDTNRQLVAEAAEREHAEAQLRQAQKMEAVGQLTGGVAHDFNNLLAAIVGNLELIQARASDERVRRWASNALVAAERGAKLTGQLLAFSRMQRLVLGPIEVNSLIEGMRPLIERSLGAGIELRLELDPAAGLAVADENQLELAILNLAINARDALPAGGRLTMATAPTERGSRGADAECVAISVSDTGTGMPPEVVERVFEPFFTTKGIGKGTGLGLSQVYGIARQSGGTASVESQVGRGTTVRIILPRASGAPAAASAAGQRASAGPPKGPAAAGASQPTLLVVDDDPDVRQLMAESLDALGYHVREAPDGQAALNSLARGLRPDAMILDFAMPGLTGAEVARAVLRRCPDLPILIATGYAETAALEGDLRKLPLLRKPFHMRQLADAVAGLLPARGPGPAQPSQH